MIAIITPTGDSMDPCTHADIIAVVQAHPTTEIITDPANGDLCDRLMGNVQIVLQHMPHVTDIGIAEADMRFPPDAFVRLQQHGRDIVAANYWQRQDRKWVAAVSDTEYVSSVGRVGLQRVLSIGCGVMLIKRRVFEAMPLPWFSRPWVASRGQHIGPDVYFCMHAGVQVWCDHDLSQEVEHIGKVRFGAKATSYATTGATL